MAQHFRCQRCRRLHRNHLSAIECCGQPAPAVENWNYPAIDTSFADGFSNIPEAPSHDSNSFGGFGGGESGGGGGGGDWGGGSSGDC